MAIKVGDYVTSKGLGITKPFRVESIQDFKGGVFIYVDTNRKTGYYSELLFELAEDYILKELWK